METTEESPKNGGMHVTKDRIQTVMIALALLVIPLLVIEHKATDPMVLLATWVANLVIWLAFVAEFVWGLVTAGDRRGYVRSHWFDLAIILLSPPLWVPESLQGLRSLRALRVLQIGRMGRLLRLLRLLRVFSFLAKAWTTAGRMMGRHSFAYVALSCIVFVVGGGSLFAFVEGGEIDVLDGIWWAVATLTTVGYGDVYPHTDAGRGLAVLIIICGLGMMAALTASIAAHFVGSDHQAENNEVLNRLDDLAGRLDRMEQQIALLQKAQQREVDTRSGQVYNPE